MPSRKDSPVPLTYNFLSLTSLRVLDTYVILRNRAPLRCLLSHVNAFLIWGWKFGGDLSRQRILQNAKHTLTPICMGCILR